MVAIFLAEGGWIAGHLPAMRMRERLRYFWTADTLIGLSVAAAAASSGLAARATEGNEHYDKRQLVGVLGLSFRLPTNGSLPPIPSSKLSFEALGLSLLTRSGGSPDLRSRARSAHTLPAVPPNGREIPLKGGDDARTCSHDPVFAQSD
jgi:hypothetical protein